MHPLQAASMIFVLDDVTSSVTAGTAAMVGLGECIHALVGDAGALDQAYPFKLGQSRQSGDGFVSQVDTATQIDVADAVTELDKALDSLVGDMAAVTQMDIVEISAESRDGVDGDISDVATFGEHQVA
jgi:hypothetical protein